MHGAELLGLALAAVAVTAVARRLGWQAPLLLVVVGLAASAVPGMPDFAIDGELLLALVLPPLLYSAALGVSYAGFRSLLHPIVQLGVVLVLVTAVVVALLARLVVPGLPMPVALVLGAIVAPPDAVSAAAVGRRLGLPRPMMTVLSGESLINDAAALTFYKVALAAVFGAGGGLLGLDWGSASGTFGLAVGVGVGLGLALGVVVHLVRMRLDDPVVESVLGLIVPFAAYLLAEELSGSGVLAVVAAGLYLGHRGPEAGYATRLQEMPLWSSLDLLLQAVVFALIGLQLRAVVDEVADSERSTGQLLVAAAVVLATVIVVRAVFVFGLELVRRTPRPVPGGRWVSPARPPWSYQTVISWTGMRGVVTLAVAAALPEQVNGAPFADREAVQFLAYAVTIGTLLLQGLTLPRLIRRLGVRDPEQDRQDAESELRLQERTTAAALQRAEELIAAARPRVGDERADQWAERIRGPLQARTRTMRQTIRADEEEEQARGRKRAEGFRYLRQQVVQAQRRALMTERDRGTVDDEVVRGVLQELDYEEAASAHSWTTRL
ncbi:Na+/H+ antiporter [Modestobacter muralis]|uniref:Na+/H+ antiporter n=1 Tax=Modestobacter muralis TaxID=1608614 RepID=A0A6P0EUN6_9ACTN|nr:Na+/H+ antiporter [Modestobacter muralis]NEK94725.1 Na+/H+ antiporter [Modestobacter muralis]NEN51613.1 Na+/H+ antiporter [Modestobacter muralis]